MHRKFFFCTTIQPSGGRRKKKLRYAVMKHECSICLSCINTRSLCITECCHFFHEKCLFEWYSLNKTCPICRHDIVLFTSKKSQKHLNEFEQFQRVIRRFVRNFWISTDYLSHFCSSEHFCSRSSCKMNQTLDFISILLQRLFAILIEFCTSVYLYEILCKYSRVTANWLEVNKTCTNKRHILILTIEFEIWKL